MKNIFKNTSSIDKDYELAKDDYCPKEYVVESIENADVTKSDTRLLKKWLLSNKRKAISLYKQFKTHSQLNDRREYDIDDLKSTYKINTASATILYEMIHKK